MEARGGTRRRAERSARASSVHARLKRSAAAVGAAVECRRAINVSPSGRPIGSRGSSPFAPAFETSRAYRTFRSHVAYRRPTVNLTSRSPSRVFYKNLIYFFFSVLYARDLLKTNRKIRNFNRITNEYQ